MLYVWVNNRCVLWDPYKDPKLLGVKKDCVCMCYIYTHFLVWENQWLILIKFIIIINVIIINIIIISSNSSSSSSSSSSSGGVCSGVSIISWEKLVGKLTGHGFDDQDSILERCRWSFLLLMV